MRPGFTNWKQNCFLNATVQLLASCDEFVGLVKTLHDPTCTEAKALFDGLKQKSETPLSSENLTQACYKQFGKDLDSPNFDPAAVTWRAQQSAADLIEAWFSSLQQSALDQIFALKFCSVVTRDQDKCMSFESGSFTNTKKEDKRWIFALPKGNSIEESLLDYFKENEDKCVIPGHENHVNRTSSQIGELPNYILMRRSDNQDVVVPGQLVMPGSKKPMHLLGMILHSGTEEGGHYISIVRQGSAWLKCDDGVVVPVQPEQEEKSAFKPNILLYKVGEGSVMDNVKFFANRPASAASALNEENLEEGKCYRRAENGHVVIEGRRQFPQYLKSFKPVEMSADDFETEAKKRKKADKSAAASKVKTTDRKKADKSATASKVKTTDDQVKANHDTFERVLAHNRDCSNKENFQSQDGFKKDAFWLALDMFMELNALKPDGTKIDKKIKAAIKYLENNHSPLFWKEEVVKDSEMFNSLQRWRKDSECFPVGKGSVLNHGAIPVLPQGSLKPVMFVLSDMEKLKLELTEKMDDEMLEKRGKLLCSYNFVIALLMEERAALDNVTEKLWKGLNSMKDTGDRVSFVREYAIKFGSSMQESERWSFKLICKEPSTDFTVSSKVERK